MAKLGRRYTPEEIRFVKENVRGRSYAEMTKLFNERFRLRITLRQMKALMHNHGLRNGIGSFLPGHVPSNKGKTRPGWRGNYKPVGSEQMNGGYVAVKVAAGKNQYHKNWRRRHVVIWEEANGKIPRGHAVIFADGNRWNFALDNLLLVSRKELAVMNKLGLVSADGDLTRAGKAVADIKLTISERKRGAGKKKKSQRGNFTCKKTPKKDSGR
jgi:hypothetical protein